MTIRILLIDDHPVVRAGLRALLETEADLEVVGEADRGARAVGLAHTLRPDVVVTDLVLPDIDGVVVTQRIRAASPQTQVVILTGANEQNAYVIRAVQGGAIGYMLKNEDAAELVRTIRSAAQGQVHLSAQAAARLIREMRSPANQVPLTDREQQVLRGLAIGRTNKEIAGSLDIALTTVKSHVRAILDKLGVDSRTQAAVYAVRSQLLASAEVQAA
jgi:DNA-binding NarL/FixJ family response regulator